MHYETVAECLCELVTRGDFEGEALALLIGEVRNTNDLVELERAELLGALMQLVGCYGDQQALDRIARVLGQYEKFNVEFGRAFGKMLADRR